MAISKYLGNTVPSFRGTFLWAGTPIDPAAYDVAALEAAGAELYDATDPQVVIAAGAAQAERRRGRDAAAVQAAFQASISTGISAVDNIAVTYGRAVTFEQYGVKGDGTAQDASLYAAAIAAAGPGGRIVCDPLATYRTTAGLIQLPAGLQIDARGARFLRLEADDNAPFFDVKGQDVRILRAAGLGDWGRANVPATRRFLVRQGDPAVANSGPQGLELLDCEAKAMGGGLVTMASHDGAQKSVYIRSPKVQECGSGIEGLLNSNYIQIEGPNIFDCTRGISSAGGTYVSGGIISGCNRNIEFLRSNTVSRCVSTTLYGASEANIYVGPGPLVGGGNGPFWLGMFFEGCKIEWGDIFLDTGCRAIFFNGGSMDVVRFHMTTDPTPGGDGDGWVVLDGVWLPFQAIQNAFMHLEGDVDFSNKDVFEMVNVRSRTPSPTRSSGGVQDQLGGQAMYNPNAGLSHNLVCWLDGQLGLTLDGSNNVSAWASVDTQGSPMGGASQATALDRPAVAAYAAPGATRQGIQSSGGAIELATAGNVPNAFTLVVVARLDVAPGAGILAGLLSIGTTPNSGSPRFVLQYRGGDNVFTLNEDVNYTDTGITTASEVGKTVCWVYTSQNGLQHVYRNNVLVGTDAQATFATAPLRLFDGFNGYLASTIFEVLVFDGVLSAAEIKQITLSYAKPKWGLSA